MILAFTIGFLEISWTNLIDVSLVAILLYQVYKLLKGSIAMNIFFGILALYLIYLLVKALQMELLATILGQFMGVGVLAMIILFQPELRKFLLLIGRTTDLNKEGFIKSFTRWGERLESESEVQEVMEATKTLKATRTGALVVFSR
ncbi:MAG: TIGR00159 family protein, partial [Cyclobacteriaceae bacterium]